MRTLSRSKLYKSDGENTAYRQTLSANTKFRNRRKTLSGFPFKGRFETKEEIDSYFAGDRIQCLLCGKFYKMLATHIVRIHGVSVDNYKKQFGLPWCKGLSCEDSSKKMSINSKRRVAIGDIKVGVGHLSQEQKDRLWYSKKRPRCPADKKEHIKRGRKALEKINRERPPAKPKPDLLAIAAAKREKTKQKILNLHHTGLTQVEIAKTLNISRNTVRRRLKESGVSKGADEIRSASNKRKALVVDLRENKKMKLRKIAQSLDISLARVDQILKEHRSN